MNVPSITTPVAHAAAAPVGLTDKVSIRKLDFYYGDSKALNGVSLPLYEHKATAFIGPFGCGKSTLLRVLNRMYELYPNQRADGESSGSDLPVRAQSL